MKQVFAKKYQKNVDLLEASLPLLRQAASLPGSAFTQEQVTGILWDLSETTVLPSNIRKYPRL